MGRRERPRGSDDERILPLINVVFLLLIVFMLMGKLTPSDPFEVLPPQSDQGDRVETLELVILAGADGRYALDGRVLERDDVVEAVAAGLADTPDAAVRLKADGSLEAVDVVAFIEALKTAGVTRLELLTEHVGVPE